MVLQPKGGKPFNNSKGRLRLWRIRFQTIASPAAHVRQNVLQEQSQKATTNTLSTLKLASTAVLANLFALSKLRSRHNHPEKQI